MNRTLAGMSLILMLLTGLVLGQLRTIESAWQAPTSASSAASVQDAYEFYDAINDFISNGDPGNLRSKLHPEFVDHSIGESGPAAGADLERYLDSVRLISPGLRFSATAVLRAPGVVAVSLMSKSPANEEDAELRLDVHGSLPEFDLLKFRGSQVIERWSFPAAPSLGRMEALATFTLGHSPPAAGFILERFTLDAFEQLDFLHEPGIVILPESGLATCETIATSSFEQMQETQEQCRKHPGSEIVIESGRSIRLSNPGAEPATLLTLRLQQEGKAPDSVQPESSSKAPPEAEGQMLAFGPFDQELRGPLEVVIQEVYLQPENGMSVHSAVGEEVVLAIDGGVFVSWQGGAVESFASNGNVDPIRTPRTMTAGEALVAHHGSRLAYRNTSDRETTLLVFRIVPAETATA